MWWSAARTLFFPKVSQGSSRSDIIIDIQSQCKDVRFNIALDTTFSLAFVEGFLDMRPSTSGLMHLDLQRFCGPYYSRPSFSEEALLTLLSEIYWILCLWTFRVMYPLEKKLYLQSDFFIGI